MEKQSREDLLRKAMTVVEALSDDQLNDLIHRYGETPLQSHEIHFDVMRTDGVEDRRKVEILADSYQAAVDELLQRFHNNADEVVTYVRTPQGVPGRGATLRPLPNDDYAINPQGYMSAWISCGPIAIRIRKNDEGLRVHAYAAHRSLPQTPIELGELPWDAFLDARHRSADEPIDIYPDEEFSESDDFEFETE